jgi:tetratricopeptide (TPR) repeat protein
MRFLVEYLSGNVPGGFLALFFILFTVNVALFYLYKSSKLFDQPVYKRRAIGSNVLIVGLYVFLWLYLQPPGVPEQIIFLPAGDHEEPDILYAEILQENLEGRFDEDLRLHRWEWLYHSANPDSFHLSEYRINLAEHLGIEIILLYEIVANDQVEYRLVEDGTETHTQIMSGRSVAELAQKMVRVLVAEGDIIERNRITVIEGDNEYWQKWSEAKWLFVTGGNEALSAKINPNDRRTKILLAQTELQKGIRYSGKNIQSNLSTDLKNPHFQQILYWLVPYGREERDNAEMNICLGRMYLFKSNYGLAEVCLKRAVTQNQHNPRIYYYMSFLHPSRISEIGYEDRIAILEQAVRLDEGYVDAIYELANELYSTGTGTPGGYSTTRARQLLQAFLSINPDQPKILSLLGRIYLQTKFTLEAQDVFKCLVELFPDSAENHYNLGICNYQLKKYDEAESNFRQAIELEDHLESYLYMGAIARHRENYKQALYYFRERIRRKQGNEDHYAREAMRQVRIILDILADSTAQGETGEVQAAGN